ncbi:MAG: rhodanese-like domain-containing protein [Desulfuromonadales bacterium]
MTAAVLVSRIEANRAPIILDVRSGHEYSSGHILGAVHAPLTVIAKVVAKVARGKSDLIILTCEHGPRAQIARGLLRWRGYQNIELLEGHMSGWRRSGLPVKTGR